MSLLVKAVWIFQTKFGKAPYGVSRLAKKYQKPVFACAGYIGKDVDVPL